MDVTLKELRENYSHHRPVWHLANAIPPFIDCILLVMQSAIIVSTTYDSTLEWAYLLQMSIGFCSSSNHES